MTPLAMKVAHQLALPKAKQTINDEGDVLSLIGPDLHCFEVSAVGKTVDEAMDEENMWNEVGTMLPDLFLPAPLTWLEVQTAKGRIAWIVEEAGIGFRVWMVIDGPPVIYTTKVCEFASAGMLAIDPILVKPLTKIALDPLEELLSKPLKPDDDRLTYAALPLAEKMEAARGKINLLEFERTIVETTIGRLTEMQRFHNRGVVWTILVLDLINTPGLVGLRQHDPHRGLARKLAGVGSYPLRGWSEIVLKHQTKAAEPGEHRTGAHFHKCLHFVRSHRRHYRNGHVTIIPAHWRGDPALGIKRTRYRVAA